MELYFGKHLGEPVEYVGVVDYCYLDWVQRKAENCSPELKKEIVRVRGLLNSFASQVSCKHKGCSRPGSKITITDNIDLMQQRLVDVSVSSDFVWCDAHIPLNTSCDGAKVYSVRFDILLEYPHSPASIRRDIANVLFELSGWPRGRTKRRKEVVDHVNGLEGRLRPKEGQLPLF